MKKTLILYGPTGGNTEHVAGLIAKELAALKPEVISVKDAKAEVLESFDQYIIGVSTLGTHNWSHSARNDWDLFFPVLKQFDFKGKTVALFGLGDQIAYTHHFADDLGNLYHAVLNSNAKVVGQWPTDGYEFNESVAFENGKFVGLVIDEDHQDDLTPKRVKQWCQQIINNLQ